MKTFREFVRLKEELWHTTGPQDNPSNPGTKSKNNANHVINNKRWGSVTAGAGTAVPSPGGPPAGPPGPPGLGPLKGMKKS